MKKKMILEIILSVIILSMFSIRFNTSVEADGTIYIRPDGSVDPPTTPIQRVGDVYTFTDDIYESIVIERDNIIIDGNGYTIQGPGNNFEGLHLDNVTQVTVKNTKITEFGVGIWIDGGYSCGGHTISNNTITNNGYGVVLIICSENLLTGNTVSNNTHRGISVGFSLPMHGSHDNSLIGNTLTNNSIGIDLIHSGHNLLSANIMTDNHHNFEVYSLDYYGFIQDIDTSNMVNGKPIYYLVNQFDKEIPLDAGFVGVVDSAGIIVRNLTLSNNGNGVIFAYTNDSVIQNIDVFKNREGVGLYESHNNTIIGDIVTNNHDGINLLWSNSNAITGNTLTNNYDGIYFRESSNNIIVGNNVINNTRGIYLSASNRNVIRSNTITNSETLGIQIKYSYNNTIHYNNFVENTEQVSGEIDTLTENTWDDGGLYNCPVCGVKRPKGNYWSDYTGRDDGSPTQAHNCPCDGIGDTETPHLEVDKYPLMSLWIPIEGDINLDGIINIIDIGIAAKNFGKTDP